jgi:acyl-CoA reductase-like NAD-dependent aldehyde dehydrogenase
MKPASMTPLGAIIMGEVLAECDILPEGAFSILPATRDGADLFTTDERLKLLSFTGSPGVGWDLKAKAGKKKVVLELGGNAAVIVDKDADLKHALDRIIFGTSRVNRASACSASSSTKTYMTSSARCWSRRPRH